MRAAYHDAATCSPCLPGLPGIGLLSYGSPLDHCHHTAWDCLPAHACSVLYAAAFAAAAAHALTALLCTALACLRRGRFTHRGYCHRAARRGMRAAALDAQHAPRLPDLVLSDWMDSDVIVLVDQTVFFLPLHHALAPPRRTAYYARVHNLRAPSPRTASPLHWVHRTAHRWMNITPPRTFACVFLPAAHRLCIAPLPVSSIGLI